MYYCDSSQLRAVVAPLWFKTIQEGHAEPWATFTEKMAVGMGQMETKVFPAMFPEDFEVQ